MKKKTKKIKKISISEQFDLVMKEIYAKAINRELDNQWKEKL